MQEYKILFVSFASLWLGMSTVRMLVAARDGEKRAGVWFFIMIVSFWATILALVF